MKRREDENEETRRRERSDADNKTRRQEQGDKTLDNATR